MQGLCMKSQPPATGFKKAERVDVATSDYGNPKLLWLPAPRYDTELGISEAVLPSRVCQKKRIEYRL